MNSIRFKLGIIAMIDSKFYILFISIIIKADNMNQRVSWGLGGGRRERKCLKNQFNMHD